MTLADTDTSARQVAQLVDENEQLRTALESALEDSGRLAEDRERLLRRAAGLARDLHAAHAQLAAQGKSEEARARAAIVHEQSASEEKLRVALEETQVLAEELEVANSSLLQSNQDLDARVEERTRQVQDMNATLLRAEASLRAIADLVPDLLWRATAAGQVDWFNRRWFAHTGQTEAEARGMGWLDAVHPLERRAARDAWMDAVQRGLPFQHELRIGDTKGEYRWYLMRAEPLHEEHRIGAWFAAGTDIHEQRTAMDKLRQSENRFRTLLEGMPQLVWRAVGGGQWTWSSPQWRQYTGQDEEQSRGAGWLGAFHPDDRDAALAAWASAEKNGTLEFAGRIFHAPEQRYRHYRTRALPVRADDGTVVEWLGTSTDVDDMLQLQQQQNVLVAELQHRTRNLMAVVQSVTRRTLKDRKTVEEFRKGIDDRFQALARVQSLLSRRDGLRVSFDVLLETELSAHTSIGEDGRGLQIMLDGPKGIALRSATVQTLALALHELATNAVKYGAFATGGGLLEVRWDVGAPQDGERLLSIDWRERGVPGLATGAPPLRHGYGRELIEHALPYSLGARTTYGFEEDGVHCTIEVSVPSDDDHMENVDD